MIDDVFIGHAPILSASAIIASTDLSEARRYSLSTMPTMSVGQRIREARKERGLNQKELGDAIGVTQSVISEMEAGKLKNWPIHSAKLVKVLGKPRAWFDPDEGEHIGNTPDIPELPGSTEYVSVQVLPTYAGMGGGGTGEGEVSTALLPRSLVEDQLRAKPSDLLIINVRGNSMEPLFYQDDQLIIDRRDVNPIQPGPFALWDGDGYVVKNIERNPKTKKYRVFSSNSAYSEHEFDPEEITIMGRPVWYARRL